MKRKFFHPHGKRDRELQRRLVREAQACHRNRVPWDESIQRLRDMAGNNFGVFQGIRVEGNLKNSETQAVIRILHMASRDRQELAPPLSVGRTEEEQALLSLDASDAFIFLAEKEPRLSVLAAGFSGPQRLSTRDDQLEESGDESGRELDQMRAIYDAVSQIVGPSATGQTGILASPIASVKATHHLRMILGIGMPKSKEWWPR